MVSYLYSANDLRKVGTFGVVFNNYLRAGNCWFLRATPRITLGGVFGGVDWKARSTQDWGEAESTRARVLPSPKISFYYFIPITI